MLFAALVMPHVIVVERATRVIALQRAAVDCDAILTAAEEGRRIEIEPVTNALGVWAAARRDGLPEPIGVGIASPGPLDPWRGVVVAPPNLAGWRNVPLGAMLTERLGRPVRVVNDLAAAAWGGFGPSDGVPGCWTSTC